MDKAAAALKTDAPALQASAPAASRGELEASQALLDDGMRLVSLDVGHEAHATGVVFLGGVVQA